jgi:hypothetical protein
VIRALFTAALIAGCSAGGGSKEPPHDTPATAIALGPITAVTVTGRIERVAGTVVASGSLDYYRFQAASDGQLRIRLDLPSGADYDLALFDAQGAHRLATSRADNRDAVVGPIEWMYASVASDRTYFVEVGGYAGVAGEYRLALEIAEPDASTASAVGPLAQARSFHAMVALPDGRALVAGGTTDPSSQTAAILSAVETTELFEPTANRFVAGPDLGAPRFGPVATLLPTGRVLLAGGDLGGTADLFDPLSADERVSLRIPMTGGVRVLPTATLMADGRVLLAGGTTIAFNPLPTAQTLDTTTIFDPKTREFTAGPRMNAARTSHAAVRLPDGRLLLTGGVGLADSEWIDADGTASTPGPAMNGVRDDLTATTLADGTILLAGGQDGSGRSLDTAELLDPGAQTFRLLAATMSDRRADHQAVRWLDGSVLLLGGEDDPGGGPDVILDSVDRFDPTTETFVPGTALLVPRDDHRVARLLDGRILITGGEDATSTSIRDTEIHLPPNR